MIRKPRKATDQFVVANKDSYDARGGLRKREERCGFGGLRIGGIEKWSDSGVC